MTAPQLGSVAIKGAIESAELQPEDIEEVLMGNVVSAGVGQAPARQAALGAGLPTSVICTTVNKVCASGMKAVMLGAQSIQLGINDCIVAGGMESMSNIPHYLQGSRLGLRMGHGQLTDGMILDGLWDPYKDVHMGTCADRCAQQYSISRAEQDAHAIESHKRARRAHDAGFSGREIMPVEVPGRRGQQPTVVDRDEGPLKLNQEKLQQLRPAFSNGKAPGTVTPGNASPVTDGAAALVLTSPAKARQRGLTILARIRGYGDAEREPDQFTTAPALAIPRALKAAGLTLDDIDYFEINEAFSVVDLVNRKLLGLDPDRVNVHGGAVAIGHPIGASGAALIIRLLSVLKAKCARLGVAAICNGGGGASAIVLERS
ncbi:aspartate transaminase aat1 [Coccomyxa viridis]|uniref:acetyl-CoA C-acetyltransferase n=1 Tax=Coccomyxa viridis TaxID=1274662 RepID=A0AAV1IGA3_9CHLO|nr:aspartate transaminase aat1 [Coccomyxa viridis]